MSSEREMPPRERGGPTETDRPPVQFVGRDWSLLGRILGSLPAACGLVGVPVVIGWLLWVDLRLVEDYKTTAVEAAQAGDDETVVLAYRRLVREDPQRDDHLFGLAQAWSHSGQREQARRLLARLAPAAGRGYEPARLWWAQQRMAANPPTIEDARAAEAQLRLVLEFAPENSEAGRLLCRLCLDSSRLSEAEQYLAKAPLENRFDLRVRLARALRQIGDGRRAAGYAAPAAEFFERLVFRDPADVEARLWWAESLTLQDRYEQAVAVLETGLQRSSESGTSLALGGAYLAWAQSLDARLPHNRTVRDRLLEQCLTALRQGPVGNADVDRQTASALISLGKLDEAEPYLERAVKTHPGLLLEWARLHGARGDTARAVTIAEEALEKYAEAVRRQPQSEQLRILAADAEFLLRRYEAAVATLEAGITTGTETVLKRAAAKVLVGWFDALVDPQHETSRAAAVELLRRACEFDPWNSEAVQRLEVSRARWRGAVNPAGITLDELLATKEPPATILATLGARATAAGELDRARLLLERAYGLAPRMLDVANNLAWVLAHQAQPDLARALDIASKALEDAGGNSPLLLGTRGEIYARLENWRAARHDLEAALPTLNGRPAFHKLLAEVYERLQEPALAQRQRESADRQAPPKSTPTP
jgi:tetratricopeptide (TPR) repeat protein